MSHHHNGHICSDPSCACHGGEAEKLVSNSLILSKTGAFSNGSRTMGELEANVSGVLLKIAELLVVDGFVLGHIKAVIRADASVCGISVTRVGESNVVYTAGEPAVTPKKWSLTVNIISAVNTQAPVKPLLDELFTNQ